MASWHAAGVASCAESNEPASTAGRGGLLPGSLPAGKSCTETLQNRHIFLLVSKGCILVGSRGNPHSNLLFCKAESGVIFLLERECGL